LSVATCFQDWAKHILNSCTEAVNPDSTPEYHQTSGNRQLNSASLNILFHNFLLTMWTFFYDLGFTASVQELSICFAQSWKGIFLHRIILCVKWYSILDQCCLNAWACWAVARGPHDNLCCNRQLNSASLNILFHNFLLTMWTFFYDFPYCKDDSG
jgi:hypothetical protein